MNNANDGGHPLQADPTWLRSARGVREAAQMVFEQVARGGSDHFELHLDRLEQTAELVAQITLSNYPDLETIPFHSRLAHFAAGGVPRLDALCTTLGDVRERLRCLFDLTITSVLLDAGAGSQWAYREAATGQVFTRSEGLAVASFEWFCAGGLSSDVAKPHRADSEQLQQTTATALAQAFQVGPGNPLVGVPGRVHLLGRLGHTVGSNARLFPGVPQRPGTLADTLMSQLNEGTLRAHCILDAVLEGLAPIWPGRESVNGTMLGDVWTHSRFGRIPFHKLSQWLAYSLADVLQLCGVHVTQLDELTGLAEYRNGGLFVDAGVIQPKYSSITNTEHSVDSDVVIEWRALTIALLDRVAAQLQKRWGKTAAQLPLVKVLQGGTWASGRHLAAQMRQDASSPIRVVSDGTVF